MRVGEIRVKQIRVNQGLGVFPNEVFKNITLCHTFLYRLEPYRAAAASANVYINTMRHFNQKRSHSIQKTMLEWTLSC